MLSKNKIKYIQSLYQKKTRDTEKVFVIEGHKMVSTVLTQNFGLIKAIYATPSWNINNNLASEKLEIVTEQEMQRISKLKTPSNVLAIVAQKHGELPAVIPNEWCLVLDDIQDPGNLGTIIRTADWFGVKHIICSSNTVDCYNSKVLQSTMGSIWNVNIIYTDIVNFLQKQKEKIVLGAFLQGTDIVTYKNSSKGGILIIGNEGNGISEQVEKLINEQITIIGNGNAESLNAAVATGILLSYLTKKG